MFVTYLKILALLSQKRLETGNRLLLVSNRNLHMGFQLVLRSVTMSERGGHGAFVLQTDVAVCPFKVTEGHQLCTFLLVINNNLGSISHRFLDIDDIKLYLKLLAAVSQKTVRDNRLLLVINTNLHILFQLAPRLASLSESGHHNTSVLQTDRQTILEWQ